MKNSKLFIFIAVVVVLIVLVSVGFFYFRGNKAIFDTANKFNYAYIKLPNGEIIEGKVESWLDFEDGDQLQIKIDGVTYLVHSINATLVKK